MFDLGPVVTFFGTPLVRLTRAADTYDADGRIVSATATSTPIAGTIAPATDADLRIAPDGIRNEITATLWTPAYLAPDDQITHDGQTFRVLHVNDRPIGGYRKAMLGALIT